MNLFSFLKDENLEKYREDQKALIDAELEIYSRNEQLKIDEENFARRNSILDLQQQCLEQTSEAEHKFHFSQEEKGIKLASLDAEIKARELAMSAIKDVKQVEIELLKEVHKKAIEDKDGIIDLLKTQVEVLTAKLTEIKIDSVQLTANLKTDKE